LKKSKVKSDSSSPSSFHTPSGKFDDVIDSTAQVDLGELDREISKIEDREKIAESPLDRMDVLNGLKKDIDIKREETKQDLEELKKQEETKQEEADRAGEKEDWDKSEKLDAEIEANKIQQADLEETTKQEISEIESQWEMKNTLLREGYLVKQKCVAKEKEMELEIISLKKDKPNGWKKQVKGKRAEVIEYKKLIARLDQLNIVSFIEKNMKVSLTISNNVVQYTVNQLPPITFQFLSN